MPFPVPGETLSKKFEWIIVTGAIGAFLFGFATGSNDVANAFGTSVGSKSLSLRTAVILAVLFEFTGAIVLGRVSAETIAGGIAQPSVFAQNPVAYAYGMSVVLWVGAIVQVAASYLGLNVSATHCVIGGIVGFAMAFQGAGAVYWAEPDSTKIPPIKGVVPIILAWFFSPILTAICSASIYGITVFTVLKHPNSARRAMYVLPVLVFCTIMIDVYFVFTKGAKKSFSSSDDWTDSKAAWISAIIAVGCSILSGILGIPYLQRKLRQKSAAVQDSSVQEGMGDQKAEKLSESDAVIPSPTNELLGECKAVGVPEDSNALEVMGKLLSPSHAKPDGPPPLEGSLVSDNIHDTVLNIGQPLDGAGANSKFNKFKQMALHGVQYDIHKKIEEDEVVNAIHANAKVWDEDTEYVFGFLQVISAICVIFAHGAGEVGYMAGPLAVIYNVVSNPGNNIISNNSKVSPEIWIILISAFGLVIGLAGYGYKVCEAVGTQLAKITPSRGFAAELATSFVIMIAAQIGLPTSSSQCITGGIIGVALWEGRKGLNIRFVLVTMSSWAITTVGMAIVCAAIFANTLYGPSIDHEFRYNKNLSLTYVSYCSMYYNCKGSDVYLKDCGFKDGDPNAYYSGTCTNCTDAFKSKKCGKDQYLKGCKKLSSGSCTYCNTTKCASDEILDGCGLLKPGKCIKKCWPEYEHGIVKRTFRLPAVEANETVSRPPINAQGFAGMASAQPGGDDIARALVAMTAALEKQGRELKSLQAGNNNSKLGGAGDGLSKCQSFA